MKALHLVILLILSNFFVSSTFAQQNFIPGEYVIKLAETSKLANPKSLNFLINSGYQIKRFIAPGYLLIQTSIIDDPKYVLSNLKKYSDVELIEPNYIVKLNRTANDLKFDDLWGLKNHGQRDSEDRVGLPGTDINVEKAWDIETGSKKIIVAVVDTGIDYNHPDLKNNIWVNQKELEGVIGVDDDNNGFIDDIYGYNFADNNNITLDDYGHGTHVAGTIGASTNNELGISGISWDVSIMSAKFLNAEGTGTMAGAIGAISYALKMGANILNNSWSGPEYSEILKNLIAQANEQGALFVCAAGNDAINLDTGTSYPASFKLPNLIAVAAINSRGDLADFSNYGKTSVHIAAPGVNISSTVPNENYATYSGTSMASPHVAGIASLLLAHEPLLTPPQIIERLISTAKPVVGAKDTTVSGGMVDAYYALTNQRAPDDVHDPRNWPQRMEYKYSTPHPYEESYRVYFEIIVPGAKQISIHFKKFYTERDYDTLKFLNEDGEVIAEYGGHYDDLYTIVLDTNHVTGKFWTSHINNDYGFDIDYIAYR